MLLSTLVNLGTLLSVSACGAAATASFAGAGVSAVLLLFNWLKARPPALRRAPHPRLPCQVFGAPSCPRRAPHHCLPCGQGFGAPHGS